MFNLENAIKSWKRELRSNTAFEDGDIAELETHLREQIDVLRFSGKSEEAAFQKAVESIGELKPIGNEMYKSRASGGTGKGLSRQMGMWIFSLMPNYAKVAVRSFRGSLVFSLINILALSVAFSVSLLVITFVKDQADYDAFHSQANRIYRVTTTSAASGGMGSLRYASSPYALAPILVNELPEVEAVTRLQPFSGSAVVENERLALSGFRTDSQLFELFDFELAIGNPEAALKDPQSIVITQETARRLFGDTNPLERIVTLNTGREYRVTGVLSAKTYRSHLEFEILINDYAGPMTGRANASAAWDNPVWYTYLLLKREALGADIEEKLGQVVDSYYPSENKADYRFQLQALTEINLGERLARQIGRITPVEFVYFLSALAIVIMLAACINYVNLTTARSQKRSKEIGLRKVIGAGRGQLVTQFLIESLVTAVLSLLIGVALFWAWLLPYWNSLQLATADFGRIAFDTVWDPELYLIFIGFTLAVGMISGIYPAIKLSAYLPSQALKGHSGKRGSGNWRLRKVLIVFQVSLSLVLLISTLLLYRQSGILLKADYGFNKSNTVNVALGDVFYPSFRADAANLAGISSISATSTLPGVEFPNETYLSRVGLSDSLYASIYSVDTHFLNSLEIDLVAGRNFSLEYATDSLRAVIINNNAADRLGFDTAAEAIGGFVTLRGSSTPYQIIGIVEDFRFDFLWEPISPLILRYHPPEFKTASIKLAGSNHETALANLEAVWKKHTFAAPFTYHYYTEQIENVYNDFEELVDIIAFLSVLAIIIASFGLLAMAHYDTQTRIKEIGIRKVLGASVQGLVLKLSSDYLKMIGIAIGLGLPLAIYLNNLWLQIFSHKADFGIGIVLAGIAITVCLTFASISIQAYNAAITNPIKNLRSE